MSNIKLPSEYLNFEPTMCWQMRRADMATISYVLTLSLCMSWTLPCLACHQIKHADSGLVDCSRWLVSRSQRDKCCDIVNTVRNYGSVCQDHLDLPIYLTPSEDMQCPLLLKHGYKCAGHPP